MAKSIHQMITLEIDTDERKVKDIDPNYWNYFSSEKYWLNDLSGKKYRTNCRDGEKCQLNGGMSNSK